MMMASFLFKQKAREALKGNWQTALVVTFFAGIFGTLSQVLQSVTLADVQRVMDSIRYAAGNLTQMTTEQARQVLSLYDRLFEALQSISTAAWIGMLAVNVLALVLGPVLNVCCRHYFVRLNVGEDLGVHGGLTGRLSIWGRALWLYVLMGLKIFLWSLLFVIPGIIAALRYSMAPWYLADDPNLTAKQAIEKSKAVMKDKKFAFFMLEISFVGWSLLISVAQMLLGGMLGTVLMLVAAQFMSLALSVYINASCAAFYRAVSHPEGMGELYTTMRNRMRQAGMSDSDINATGFGAPQEDENDNMDEDEDL